MALDIANVALNETAKQGVETLDREARQTEVGRCRGRLARHLSLHVLRPRLAMAIAHNGVALWLQSRRGHKPAFRTQEPASY